MELGTHSPDPSSEPIYQRLIKAQGPPGETAARRIGIAVGAAGLLVALAGLAIQAAEGGGAPAALSGPGPGRGLGPGFLPLAILGTALMIGLGSLPYMLVLAALATSQFAAREDFALLRLTRIPAGSIVEAYARAAAYRLRLTREVAWWLLPAGAPGVASLLALNAYIESCAAYGCTRAFASYLPLAFVPALGVAGAAMLFLRVMARFMTGLGVWAGLRWPASAGVAAGLIAGGAALVCLATAAAVLAIGDTALTLCLCALAIAPILLVALDDQARVDAVRCIEQRIPHD